METTELQEIQKANAKKKKKLAEERAKKNAEVLLSYRIRRK